MIDLINKIVSHICYRCVEDEYAREIKHDCDSCLLLEVIDEIKSINNKPHGRLIDADKLKKQLDTVYNEMANERERKGLRLARWFLISAPTVSATKKLNNQIHLCDSCKYNYPNCPSENEDVLFGNGVGNDNICCCAKYLASADRPHGEWMIDTYNMELRCGICGETFRFDDVDELLDYKEYAKYCLACGARMI